MVGKNTVFLFLVLAFVAGCQSATEPEEEPGVDSSREVSTIIKIEDKLFSVPSPFQLSEQVRQSGVEFSPQMLNEPGNAGRYNTNFKKALNLGVYGANLGYLTSYGQFGESSRYFDAIRQLSAQMGLESLFDNQLRQRLETNRENQDSLLFLFPEIYKDADVYLFDNERNDLGVLILAGGWIESVYILSRIALSKRDQQIINRLGEQKIPLENLISLMRPFYEKQSPQFDRLLLRLVELASVFDGIQIEYQYEKPVVKPQKKLCVIKSQSKALISEYQLNTIADSVASIRHWIIE